MNFPLWRVVRSAVPSAILLGACGYAYSFVVAAAVPGGAAATRNVPVTMAAWGFGLAALFTVVGHLWRGMPAVSEKPRKVELLPDPATGLDPEVEKLLNRLLAEARAAELVAPSQVHQEAVLKEVPVAD